MRLCTPKQARELASEIQESFTLDCDAIDVEMALDLLHQVLASGETLNSGDGFYYRLRGKRLTCHDGSRLSGTLLSCLTSHVWKRRQIVEVVGEIVFAETEDLDRIRDILTSFNAI